MDCVHIFYTEANPTHGASYISFASFFLSSIVGTEHEYPWNGVFEGCMVV